MAAYEATHRFARISARKVRPMADLIRGKLADEALEILRYQPQRGARLLEKVLKSALGNAQDPDHPAIVAARSTSTGCLSGRPMSTGARCSSGCVRVPAAWRSWFANGFRTST